MTLEELTKAFSVARINRSPAIFDSIKLKAINGEYIRAKSAEEFKALALPYIRETCTREDINLDVLCAVLQPRTELVTDIPEQVDFIDELPDYDIELYTHKKMKTNEATS